MKRLSSVESVDVILLRSSLSTDTLLGHEGVTGELCVDKHFCPPLEAVGTFHKNPQTVWNFLGLS